ncbi:hypothetical protein OEZ86_006040 [Tetradesmus obliquus]|nr:hypothetical protein OEZ86_006040 [Tetradesmus obliquus]
MRHQTRIRPEDKLTVLIDVKEFNDLRVTGYEEELHRAAAAAWRISRTWKQSGHAKLLQLQPTALPNPRRAALLAETMQLATQIAELRWRKLLACFSHQEETTSAELARDVLQDIISSGAAATLAKLLVWLQQWLEALDLPGLAALPESTALAAGSYHGLWWTCTDALTMLLRAMCEGFKSAASAQAISSIAEQLQQSVSTRCKLDVKLQQDVTMWPSNLLYCLTATPQDLRTGGHERQQLAMRDLFLSQLARKHPVAFYRLLEACASSSVMLSS